MGPVVVEGKSAQRFLPRISFSICSRLVWRTSLAFDEIDDVLADVAGMVAVRSIAFAAQITFVECEMVRGSSIM